MNVAGLCRFRDSGPPNGDGLELKACPRVAAGLRGVDMSGEENSRTSPRTNLFLSALLETHAGRLAVRIRNLSETGALVAGEFVPEAGTDAILRRGELEAPGCMAWAKNGRGGLRFHGRIDLAAWLPTGTQVQQQAVDRMIGEVRSAPRTTSAERTARPPDDVLRARIAEELQSVARALELAGRELAKQPLVVARHGLELQKLDLSAETLVQLAGLLNGDSLDEGLGSISVDALRRRLMRTGL